MGILVKRLKDFETTYGWIIRYAVILVVLGVVYIADTRYLTREEIEAKELHYLKVRQEDLSKIDNKIDGLRNENTATLALLNEIKATVRGIEAQTEILIKDMERTRDR